MSGSFRLCPLPWGGRTTNYTSAQQPAGANGGVGQGCASTAGLGRLNLNDLHAFTLPESVDQKPRDSGDDDAFPHRGRDLTAAPRSKCDEKHASEHSRAALNVLH